MFSRRLKNGYFVLEGLNSFATVYFFYYFYFFMQKQFGYGNQANLLLAALNGGAYAVFTFFSGRFAQRFGYFTALKLGFGIMAGSMVAGLLVSSAAWHIAVMVTNVLGMSFTWPTLEALVSEGETRSGVQHMVGVYNVLWAATAALSNFTGGALLSYLGLASLFYVPLAIQVAQLGLTFWLEREAVKPVFPAAAAHVKVQVQLPPAPLEGEDMHPHPPANAKTFLRMAWLVNPFAYIGINTLIAVMPGIALRLGLSTAAAGYCGSVWCFARLGAFAALWLWNGWHYRFNWLITAYLMLAASFISVLLAPNIAVLVGAQLFFGSATGLLYFSSLFYSMDSSDTKGEHGGFHEAAIGMGNFAGPAVGAVSLQFFPPPQYAHSGVYAVTALLFAGFIGLVSIWRSARRSLSVGKERDRN